MMTVFGTIFKNPAGLVNVNYYLGNLVLLIAISFLTWAQQKLSSGDNPQMATMGTIMPFFMGFICLSMPGGVMLYWGLSSLVGVVQQYFVMKKAKEEMEIKPNLHKNKPLHNSEACVEDEDDEDYDYEDSDSPPELRDLLIIQTRLPYEAFLPEDFEAFVNNLMFQADMLLNDPGEDGADETMEII